MVERDAPGQRITLELMPYRSAKGEDLLLERRIIGRGQKVAFENKAVAFESRIETELSASAVEFRQLSDMDIQRYVATGEPLDKAGAYAIQGEAAAFVRALNGSYSGIMGLPVFQTLALLGRFGVNPM